MSINRPIKKIILHCSDSDYLHTSREIRTWHISKGWNDIGYHFIIEKYDTAVSNIGQISYGRTLNITGAHCRGHNYDSIGICLVGKEKFEGRQFYSLSKLLRNLMFTFNLHIDDIFPHNHFNNKKTCPNFSVEEFKIKYLGDIHGRE